MTLSTSSLNRNGYRVMTQGIRLGNFLKNPVMLYDHNRWNTPIGRWEDLRVEGDKLTAVPVFDENDPFAMGIKSKFDNGFLFSASIGFKGLKFSKDLADLLPGQEYETVMESDLLEASIVPIPGNSDATLSFEHHPSAEVPRLSPTHTDMDTKKIALALGLAEGADEAAILGAIERIGSDNRALRAQQVEGLLAIGEANGAVNAENKETWRKLAANDFENAKALLGSPAKHNDPPKPETPKGQTLMGMLNAGVPRGDGKTDDARKDWTFDEWGKKDPGGLLKMKKEQPDRYAQLAAEKYQTA